MSDKLGRKNWWIVEKTRIWLGVVAALLCAFVTNLKWWLVEKPRVWLSATGAFLKAFVGAKLEHFPRRDGGRKRIPEDAIFTTFAERFDKLEPFKEDDAVAETALKLARESLDEVKEATEYQDQKVGRQLTIVAFLTAAAGTLFARFIDDYPLRAYLDGADGGWLVFLTYAVFGLFLIFVIAGALVSFYAIKSRFKWPSNIKDEAQRPKSLLFYAGIAGSSPNNWADVFLADDGRSVRSDLAARYYQGYVTESYLVATKVADKLRYLEPAQDILSMAIRFLLLWAILLAVTLGVVDLPADETTARRIDTRTNSVPDGQEGANAAGEGGSSPNIDADVTLKDHGAATGVAATTENPKPAAATAAAATSESPPAASHAAQ